MHENHSVTRNGILLLGGLGLVWGIPYVFIKIAVVELDPAMLVLLRCAVGAVILLPVAIHRKALLPALKRWRPLLAYTAAEIVFPWFFLNTAEQRLPSSTAGLLLSAIPLVAIGIAFLMGRRERLHWRNWLGLAVGMIGVAVVVGLDVGTSDLGAVAMLLVVIVGYALGPAILARWMSDVPAIGVIALSLAIASIVYLPVVGATSAWPTAPLSIETIAAVLVLGAVCSALAFIMFFALIAEVGPVRVTAITYINPAVAVIAGAVLLGEQITVWTILGFALVLGGSYLVARHERPKGRSDEAEGEHRVGDAGEAGDVRADDVVPG